MLLVLAVLTLRRVYRATRLDSTATLTLHPFVSKPVYGIYYYRFNLSQPPWTMSE